MPRRFNLSRSMIIDQKFKIRQHAILLKWFDAKLEMELDAQKYFNRSCIKTQQLVKSLGQKRAHVIEMSGLFVESQSEDDDKGIPSVIYISFLYHHWVFCRYALSTSRRA